MAQQTLTLPGRQAPRRAGAPVSHRRPRTRTPRRSGEREVWWALPFMMVLFALFVLLGAGLIVNEPNGSSSASRPPASLVPQHPAAPEPPQTRPTLPSQRVQKPAEPAEPRPGRDAARPTGVKKVLLRPGDTLYSLAHEHDTTVKALQKLNNLGTSTLIYACDTLRVPSTPSPTGHEPRADSHHRPAPAPKDTDTLSKKRPAKGGAAAVAFAKAQVGKPYIWGGTGPRGYDCSGLVMRAWQKAGVHLPRTTWGQVDAGKATTRAKLLPSDLVISNGGGHVALYIGNGKVVHAPRTGSTVTIAPLPPASQVVAYRHITT
ncbi:peptidoglycan endopeptidase [Streptomyces sp. NBC_00390]|uniref:C40 family peptidase n=1 Tax=Streptomyces sp. NBC_00390 TaxID=2975736 RepID=UPI002E1EA06F